LRRLAGVSKPPTGGEREPAAEILSRFSCGEGSLRQFAVACATNFQRS
jgi:hypothetical protein